MQFPFLFLKKQNKKNETKTELIKMDVCAYIRAHAVQSEELTQA